MRARFCRSPSDIPTSRGAYVLWIDLPEPLALTLPSQPARRMPAGRYLYCGSARGPGGLRARVGRHMKSGKAVRWHVDRLTEYGIVQGAWIFPDARECDLVHLLAGLPAPVLGFGSSDCKECRSHLLWWPEGMALPFVVRRYHSKQGLGA